MSNAHMIPQRKFDRILNDLERLDLLLRIEDRDFSQVQALKLLKEISGRLKTLRSVSAGRMIFRRDPVWGWQAVPTPPRAVEGEE